AIVTALRRCAGNDKVTYASQPHESHRVSTQTDCKTTHFRQATGNQHGISVLPHIHGGGKTGNNRINVFECPGQLNAVNIDVCVDPEILTPQQLLNLVTHIGVFGSDNRSREVMINNLAGEIGAAQYANATTGDLFLEDFTHELEAMGFYPLGQADNNLPFPEFFAVFPDNRAKGLTRDGHKDKLCLAYSVCKIGGGQDIAGNLYTRHVAAVYAGCADFFGLGLITHPEVNT